MISVTLRNGQPRDCDAWAGGVKSVARPAGFEPAALQIITLEALAGLSYGRVVSISSAETATNISSTICDHTAGVQLPLLAPCTVRPIQSQGGAVAPPESAFPLTDEARPRLLQSRPPHSFHRADYPWMIYRQHGLIGRLSHRKECRRGRRSSASGRAKRSGQCDIDFIVNPSVYFVNRHMSTPKSYHRRTP